MGEHGWAPPDWPAGLPLPDLSRPPPWLLPPPPPGAAPPPPPPGGWRSWETAVPWPPSELPSQWSEEEEAWEEEEEEEGGGAEEAGAVVWRVGDPVDAEDDEEEEEEEEEQVLELSEEWVARFAVTAHRRAVRASPLRSCSASLCPNTLTHRTAGKQQERESRTGGGYRPAQAGASEGGDGGREGGRGGGSAPPAQTVFELVQAARAGTTRPNEGAPPRRFAARTHAS